MLMITLTNIIYCQVINLRKSIVQNKTKHICQCFSSCLPYINPSSSSISLDIRLDRSILIDFYLP